MAKCPDAPLQDIGDIEPPSEAPSPPTGISATSSARGLLIKWTYEANPEHHGFEVYRGPYRSTHEDDFSTIAVLTHPAQVNHIQGGTASMTDRCIGAGEQYSYMIRGFGHNGYGPTHTPAKSDRWTPDVAPVVGSQSANAPTLQYATDNLARTIQIVWDAAATLPGDLEGYTIWRGMVIKGEQQRRWILAAELPPPGTPKGLMWFDYGVDRKNGYYYCVGAEYSDHSVSYSLAHWGVAA